MQHNIFTQNKKYKLSFGHPYHIVSPSIFPLLMSFSLFVLVLNFVQLLHYEDENILHFCPAFFFEPLKIGAGLVASFSFLLLSFYGWYTEIIVESTFQGFHTKAVRKNILLGMSLFIVSEIMFFFAIFWAYFHVSLSPSIFIGGVWPPLDHILNKTAYYMTKYYIVDDNFYWNIGKTMLDPFALPFVNTVLLISSGVNAVWAHKSLLAKNKDELIESWFFTICFALYFLFVQGIEYTSLPFSINDGIWGSIFYTATGFHGFHVLLGLILLVICFVRILNDHFTSTRHVGFICASWYWHFVDVVWIFLYIVIYWWGSGNLISIL